MLAVSIDAFTAFEARQLLAAAGGRQGNASITVGQVAGGIERRGNQLDRVCATTFGVTAQGGVALAEGYGNGVGPDARVKVGHGFDLSGG